MKYVEMYDIRAMLFCHQILPEGEKEDQAIGEVRTSAQASLEC